ncbi:MAG: hypothetical protein MI919_15765, partial [Holophagales bacterium]|nr:hypothetical protein [Holophagales bacterium]
TIHVAVGPNGDTQKDRAEIDFSIHRTSITTTVASYGEDFQGGTPTGGWAFLWNKNGAIGTASNYVALEWDGVSVYDSDGVAGLPDASDMSAGNLSATEVRPGKGSSQNQSVPFPPDRYAIAAYTVSAAGVYAITDSSILTAVTPPQGNGRTVEVYVGDQLIRSIPNPSYPPSLDDFDTDLGLLQPGDTIYVAVGPNGDTQKDRAEIDFSVHRTSITTTVASYGEDFQGGTPAAGWAYLWNANGAIGTASNYVILEWDHASVYDSDGVAGLPDMSDMSAGNLAATEVRPGKGTAQTQSVSPSLDRYAIAAYTVSSDGYYAIARSRIRAAVVPPDPLPPEQNGRMVEVYVNDQPIDSTFSPVDPGTSVDFDTCLGLLQPGDTIYVAVGPNGNTKKDRAEFDFEIERTVPAQGGCG